MISSRFVAGWCVAAGVFPAGAVALTAQGRDAGAAAALELAAEMLVERAVSPYAAEQVPGTAAARPATPANLAGSDPLAGPVVRNAPYSGEALTTVTQILGDGTRIEQSTTAMFYRDSQGRVRREQTIMGLGPLDPSSDTQTVITIDPEPDDGFAYQLDAAARTARRLPRGVASLSTVSVFGPGFAYAGAVGTARVMSQPTVRFSWERAPGAPPQQDNRTVQESLGTRQIEGVKATGFKTTTTIPTGEIGNDRPIEITDERWESPELQILLYSRHSDPRTGVVEYRLTNVSRMEPPPDLFMVPPDYTIIEFGGVRTGGAGGRGVPAPGGRGRGR